jgi:hypothetical protein
MATPQQMKGYEEYFSDPNPNNILPYNPDPRVPGGMPVRIGQNPINSALVEQSAQASDDIQISLGVSLQTAGFNPGQQSGKALLAQKSQMQSGTREMQDNFARAKVRTGEILIDLIPKIIDTPRSARIIGEDGEAKIVDLNQTVIDSQTGEHVIVENDLGLGKYDVISDVGPSYKTQREETKEQMAFIVQTSPELAQFAMPVLLENTDSPAAREMGEMIKLQQVRQGLRPPNEKEAKILAEEAKAKEEQGPSPEEIATQLELEKLKNENLKLAAEARSAGLDAFEKEISLQSQPQQEELENAETASVINKNNASAAKLERDAREPYQKPNQGGSE